jgi:hypothetical protein
MIINQDALISLFRYGSSKSSRKGELPGFMPMNYFRSLSVQYPCRIWRLTTHYDRKRRAIGHYGKLY